MKKLGSFLCLCCFLAVQNQLYGQTTEAVKPLVLQNEICSLTIDLFGGAIVDFRLKDNNYNPFTWKMTPDEMPENNKSGASFKGHFICLGRWGAPTEGEIKSGVPHNGQTSNEEWQIQSCDNNQTVVLKSVAPLDYTILDRSVALDKQAPVFKITDKVSSTATVGRLFNIVQHVTIGPPFLAESTVVDCNAGKGFMQHLCYPEPERYACDWPVGIIDTTGTQINLTKSDEAFSYVSTHLMKNNIGWITASSPECGLLLGYVWKTDVYPWINLWHQRQDGNLWAKGLEFGTTGIGKSYQELLAVDTRFQGENSFFYLDAQEEVEKSFLGFLIQISDNYNGVESVHLENGQIIITEKQTGGKKKQTIACSFDL